LTKTIQQAVVQILRDDPVIDALVGRNDWTVKVWDRDKIPKDAPAPYVTVQRIPGSPPEGTYNDPISIKFPQVQISVWHDDADEAWQIADEIPDILLRGDYVDVEPDLVSAVTHLGDEVGLTDQDTGLVQVPRTFRFFISR